MKIALTSETTDRSLAADVRRLEQFEGRYTCGDGSDTELNERLWKALGGNGRDGVPVVTPALAGSCVATSAPVYQPHGRMRVSDFHADAIIAVGPEDTREFLKSEAKFFCIDAAARRDDRLTRFALSVLRMIVEGEAVAPIRTRTNGARCGIDAPNVRTGTKGRDR